MIQVISFIFLISISCSPQYLFAGTIYKWVDEFGHKHFTDNPANIPLKQDKYEKQVLKDLALPKSSQEPVAIDVRGEDVWKNQCSMCHYITSDDQTSPSLRSLPNKIMQADISLELLSAEIKKSLELRSADMNNLKLNDAEVKAVSQYIKATQKKAEHDH